MITDYRKQAEDLILSLGITGEIRIAGEIERLAEAFQQIAQEARREENEALIKIINGTDLGDENLKEQEVVWAINDIKEDFIKAIRSRMIGPEPMEEK